MDRSAQAAVRAWLSLSDRNESDIDVFVERCAPIVMAAQYQAVGLLAAWLGVVGDNRKLGDLELPEPNWRSPFVLYWLALKNGRSWLEAVASGSAEASKTGSDAVIRAVDARLQALT